MTSPKITMAVSPREHKYDVSVILVAYNQELSIRLALEALLHQQDPGRYEVIICDDGSRAELFSGLRNLMETASVPVRFVWQQDRGIRPGQARNNGIKLAQGSVLLFLDGDMIPSLTLVRNHAQAHQTPGLLIAGNRLWRNAEDLDLDQPPLALQADLLEREPSDAKTERRQRMERINRQKMYDSEHPWKACFTCHLSVRNCPEVFFDERMHGWGLEDWELACRLWSTGRFTPVYRDDLIAYQLEVPGLFSNVFRRNNHDEIVAHMRNVFLLADSYPELALLPEVAFGFPRFVLDETNNRWTVRERPEECDLGSIVTTARSWLSANGVYP